jgi:hypothetical protein
MEHADKKVWWHQVARIELEHFPDRRTLSEAERRAIEIERPAHNGTLH